MIFNEPADPHSQAQIHCSVTQVFVILADSQRAVFDILFYLTLKHK